MDRRTAAPVRRLRASRWLAGLLLACAMPVAWAVPRDACPRALSQYRVQAWHARDGLPQDAVGSLAQTPDGFVWIGMEDGLARFDGATFEPVDLTAAVGTRSEYIGALSIGNDGRLYAGTGASGVLVGASPARLAVAGGPWPPQPVQALLVDGTWRLAGLRGGGLVDFGNRTPTVLGLAEGLAGLGVTALSPRRQGGVWVGMGPAGVQWYDGRRFHRVPQLEALGKIHVEDLLEDRAGQLWIATRDGLLRASTAGVRRYGPADGLSSTFLRSLLEDRHGNLWIGTLGEGVLRLCAGRFERIGTERGLPAAPVEDLLEDAEGGIWVGGGGLVRLSEGAALPITPRQGLPAKPILPILQAAAGGAMWIGTFGGGLVHWTNERSRILTEKEGLSSDFVLGLAHAPNGGLWVGTRNGLDLVRDGRVVRHLGKDQGLPNPTVTSVLQDGTRVWIGTIDGVATLDEGATRAVPVPVPGGSFGAHVVMLFRDAAGVVWIGTDGAGVFQVRDGTAVPAPFASMLATNAVMAMQEVRPGVFWLATGRGLARWDGRRLAVVSSRQGLPQDNVMSLLQDGAGHLWAGGNLGVFVLSIEALDKVASGQGRITAVRQFSEFDGMPMSETNGGFQPAAWRDSRGRLWYGTREGIAVFDPAALPALAAAPRVLLRELRVDERPMALGPRIEVPPNPGLVELGYVAPSFSHPQRLEYQYRLHGFDNAWYTAEGERTAVYRQLPPGRFRFEVRARHAPGPWSAPATTEIVVAPALLERWGVRAALLLLALVAATALLRHRLRLRDRRRQHLQHAQKLESIGQLTGGIAHDFNNVLAAIVQSSDALAAALPRNHPLQAGTMEILRAADMGAGLTRQLLAFARHEPTQPRWIDLSHAIAEMESFMRRLLPPSIRVESHYEPVGACLIDPVQLQQIVLNLVLNARDAMPDGGELTLRLLPATRTTVEPLPLDADRRYAQLSVDDTGTGMSAAIRERIFEPFFTTKQRGSGTGLGLAMAYGIAREAGGTILVDAEPGAGARFHVFLPVEHRLHGIEAPPAADRAPEREAPSPGVVAAGDAATAATERVLVLDDDETVAASLATLARAEGFATRVTHTPQDFFREVDAWSPTHVIVDLVMPMMDGVEVLSALADGGYSGRTVVTSGMGAKVLEAARRSGAAHGLEVTGVLEKPFRAESLRAALRGPTSPGPAALAAGTPAEHGLPLEHELAEAVQRGELIQHYQPEVDLLSGHVVGFESLVRWRHPTRGLIYPDQFIPLAERTGLINLLTRHIIHSSLEWIASLPADAALGISINLSARSLNESSIFPMLHDAAERLGLKPERITLELTETSAMLDAVDALDTLTRLRLKGYGLAIDDFGTGFSSMMQLARLPFSQIKIDKSFVMSMSESAESRKIVESTISLGRALSLVTVAEGVEDEVSLEALRELGCDRVQGYHIARPMDGETARHWHAQWRSVAGPAGDA